MTRAAAIPFEALKADAFVVSALPNVRYLTGFTGSNAMAVFAPGFAMLFTDPRYTIQAGQESGCQVRIAKGYLTKAVAALAARKRWKRIAFERNRMAYDAWESLRGLLPSTTRLVPVQGVVEQMRMVKSAEEIALIRRSVETNSAAFEAAVRKIRPGISESDLAAEIEFQMRRRGAEKPAFDTIVATGARTALPHAQPTAQALNGHGIVLIDMGATRDGYASDMTRTLFLGKPDPRLRRMYKAVQRAQQAGVDAVREGVTAGAVDRATRNVLKAHGLEKEFVHSTGHGLGLEIHEPPRLGRRDATVLKAGMVITIEPGAYREGVGGIRIEDTVIVTKNGCDVLTPTSKELTVL